MSIPPVMREATGTTRRLPKGVVPELSGLLRELEGVENRKAQFRTVICLIEGGEERLFEGIVRGSITERKQGTSGFGYDPVFRPEGYDETFAEMGSDEKNRISHRARAVQRLVEYLTR